LQINQLLSKKKCNVFGWLYKVYYF